MITGVLTALAWAKANWRLVLAGALAIALISSHIAVYRIGKTVTEADCTADKLEQATTALETLTTRLEGAQGRAVELGTSLAGLKSAAATARKDIQNVLPKDDASCDLPPAARGVLNRSRGYPD